MGISILKRSGLVIIFLLSLAIVNAISINLDEKVSENGNLKTSVSINLDKIENSPYIIIYKITDLDNKIEFQQEGTIILENNKNLNKEFSLISIKPGKYKFIFELYIYNELVDAGEKEFEITPEPIQEKVIKQKPYTLIGYGLFILMVVFVIIILIKQKNKLKKVKISPKALKEAIKKEEVEAKVDRKLNVLKQAYKSKIISEKSYKEDNKKLKKIIKKD